MLEEAVVLRPYLSTGSGYFKLSLPGEEFHGSLIIQG